MKEYFPKVGKIKYEGPKTDNPLAFRFYNPEEITGRDEDQIDNLVKKYI